MDSPKRYGIFNTYVNALDMEETVKEVEKIIKKRIPSQHVVLNANKINLLRRDGRLRKIINSCPIINADGASILWAAKILNIPLNERVTGVDLFQRLLERSNQKGYRIFLFGAKEEVLQRLVEVLQTQYKSLKIAGYRNGYFIENEEEGIVDMIRGSKSDILFVGFSSPKKEYWIHKHLKQMNVPFVMGVGGSFDVLAGVTKRAPLWMQNYGLEWFYRFIQEPKRLWKRYIYGNIRFVLYVWRVGLGRFLHFGRSKDSEVNTND